MIQETISIMANQLPELGQSNGTDPLSRIASCLVDRLQSGATECFDGIFGEVEHCIIFGNDTEREAIIVNLLEEIKNLCAIRNIDSTRFEFWLRPETYRAWRWLEKKWKGRTSLAEEARKVSS